MRGHCRYFGKGGRGLARLAVSSEGGRAGGWTLKQAVFRVAKKDGGRCFWGVAVDRLVIWAGVYGWSESGGECVDEMSCLLLLDCGMRGSWLVDKRLMVRVGHHIHCLSITLYDKLKNQ